MTTQYTTKNIDLEDSKIDGNDFNGSTGENLTKVYLAKGLARAVCSIQYIIRKRTVHVV